MGMPAQRSVSTIGELLAIPDDGMRHELLDGVHFVTPAPARAHQRVLANLFGQLREHVGTDAPVEVLFSPADIRLDPRTLVQPDLFVVAKPTEPSQDRWADTPVPRLVAEVLSPATAARDRGAKRRLYLEAGVEECLIVDLDARLIERWRQGDERPEIVERELRWELSVGVSGVIVVSELFEQL